MPNRIATQLAIDEAVGSEELEAAVLYLNEKIKGAELRQEPIPFLAYRNRKIFEATLDLRRSHESRVES